MSDIFKLSKNEIQKLENLLANSIPVESSSLESINSAGCDSGCSGSCEGGCYGNCSGDCAGSCSGECSGQDG